MRNLKQELITINKEIESLINTENKGERIEWVHFQNLLLQSSLLSREISFNEVTTKGKFTAYDSYSEEQLKNLITDRKKRITLLTEESKMNEVEITGMKIGIESMQDTIENKKADTNLI